MILSANGILQAIQEGKLSIEPFSYKNLNPNSYEVTLGDKIAFYPLITDGSQMCMYGQTSECVDPDRFGHLAALDPNDPGVTHIMNRPVIDLAEYQDMIMEQIPEYGFVIFPGNVYIVNINEKIDCRAVVPEISGKSRLGRAGLEVHLTAGYGNLGDCFKYTLELRATYPTRIYPNMRIGQILFHTVEDSYVPGQIQYEGTYSPENVKKYSTELLGYIPDPELRERARMAKEKFAQEIQANSEQQAVESELPVQEEQPESLETEPEETGVVSAENPVLDVKHLDGFQVVLTEDETENTNADATTNDSGKTESEEEKIESKPIEVTLPENVNAGNDNAVIKPYRDKRK